ncbi:hypothetical protein Ga0466249_001735 [Sporomusaceae bacterium BoRhaA]|uniref:twin-arginine translocation signal domain-containing protein n=1 Tax=Pelorhabdus rhamnosifermentans TaxID=2772457 RepID=UPI001C062B2A|nr:twin-arginine translocation signal domain-containing protein [Pelorhabdus rhamnosifermentans]MBU2700643.1 hypothetical protein [Pelorhabdus rhamnosifermentans]
MSELFSNLNLDCNRRDFIKKSSGAMAALAFASLPITVQAAPLRVTSLSLPECLNLDPVTMARKSPCIQAAYQYILTVANEIQNEDLRIRTLEILNNPAPTLMELYPAYREKERVKQQLVSAGYIASDAQYEDFLPPYTTLEQSVIPFYAAPGSGYYSHHAYPGGLATHVAVNVKASLGFFNAYKDIYFLPMDRDIVLGAQLLHDLHKPWVFQWQENGVSRTEYTIAGTGQHHILSIAELIHRNFPPQLIVALACAHNHPGTDNDEHDVVNWLKAASILAGKDPVDVGLLSSTGKTLPLPRRTEGFLVHLGDHDFVLAGAASKWMVAKLGDIAKAEYSFTEADLKTSRFYAFRNYVFSQVTLDQLYLIWTIKGDEALIDMVKSIVNV